MKSVDVRAGLVRALEWDLVGPQADAHECPLGDPAEILPQTPSRWYLTGFLIPTDAPLEQRADETVADELDAQGNGGDLDEDSSHEGTSSKKTHYPSSCGLSLLVTQATKTLEITALWGDYQRVLEKGSEEKALWHRTPRRESVTLKVGTITPRPLRVPLPESKGLEIVYSVRPVTFAGGEGGLPQGAKSVSVFLVNRREPSPDVQRDESFAFQATLEVFNPDGFLPRPNPRGIEGDDWDERVADLQYRDALDFGVGHSVSVDARPEGTVCRRLRTCWLPRHEVERVAAAPMTSIPLKMDELAKLSDGAQAKGSLGPMVAQYRAWIESQSRQVEALIPRRREIASELLQRAKAAAKRIEAGIGLLADPVCLKAFCLANRAMASAARRRMGVMRGKDPATIDPEWRPFQLAFLLMNLKGIATPTDTDRGVVDLLFFPTGGGKTEAYLGLAAFTLVLRRLRNPGIGSSGLSVLMRYTLRLLTLDQLGRAATLICALEKERWADSKTLGDWPFEIGLWVGQAATPNRMGVIDDDDEKSARRKTIAYKNNSKKPSPVPLEECPWCGEKFTPDSFKLIPNSKQPIDLRIACLNRDCDFSQGQTLPILTVDEPIYRRLPCFLIATVDKFAAMPWTGQVGGFFGRVERHDANGFYGPSDPGMGRPLPGNRLPPPDLVIQDELHLISGPLGTIVGLYESAIDELSAHQMGDKKIYPKIVASTATVRRAESQILALFNRRTVDIFPPPGLDRKDSFFAKTLSTTESHGRLYLGVPALGRSAKVAQLRVYLILLAAAKHFFDLPENLSQANNPADPYMTLLGYFNSLRELGGTRRLVEDEIWNNLAGYPGRKRIGDEGNLFGDRQIAYEPVELTSRISTAKVSEFKRRLAMPFENPGKEEPDRPRRGRSTGRSEEKPVDVAIATNMISVGLDITRLGLMVVYGQPKTSAEYIQATSRVGREVDRPGLVVTILNLKKPRDRSHYEQFASYHESFYRSVEATSVTPFSTRALDRALAAVVVALARQGHSPMNPPEQAAAIGQERPRLNWITEVLTQRAGDCCGQSDPESRQGARERIKARVLDLLETWDQSAAKLAQNGVRLQYQLEKAGGSFKRLLYEFLHPDLQSMPVSAPEMKFRANRSMRDVEASVNLFVQNARGMALDEEGEE